MTPEQYLQSIGRNEIEKLGSGEKTGEYLITPAELEEYAEINQRDAFEAGICKGAGRKVKDFVVDELFDQWKEAQK